MTFYVLTSAGPPRELLKPKPEKNITLAPEGGVETRV